MRRDWIRRRRPSGARRRRSLVLASAGTVAAIQPRAAARTGLRNPETVDEPRIAGYGVIATRGAALRIGIGSVAKEVVAP